jgi:hypothetical protein
MALSRKSEIAVLSLLAALQMGAVGYSGYTGYKVVTQCDARAGLCDISGTNRFIRFSMLAYLNTAPLAINAYNWLTGNDTAQPVLSPSIPENKPRLREWLA